MEITSQHLLQIIEEISSKIDLLQSELRSKEEELKKLQTQNNELINSNHHTLSQIKEYIKELEVIRSHYATNKN